MPSSKETAKIKLSGRLVKIVPEGNEDRASWYLKTPDGKDVYLVVVGWSRAKYDQHVDKRVDCEGEWRGPSFLALKAQENRYGG